jgi:hypothetical protein
MKGRPQRQEKSCGKRFNAKAPGRKGANMRHRDLDAFAWGPIGINLIFSQFFDSIFLTSSYVVDEMNR